jgi:hypothetical protein
MSEESLLKGKLKQLDTDGNISIQVQNLSFEGDVNNITVDSQLDVNSTNPVQNKVIAEKLKEMTGCKEFTDGTSGFVPAPPRGSQNKFLRGDGLWVTIETRTSYPFTANAFAFSTDEGSLNKRVVSGETFMNMDQSAVSNNKLVGSSENLGSIDLVNIN